MPSLFSVSTEVKPRIPFSSTNALIPLCPAAGSVFANTSAWSATVAYEIQFFWPFNTYVSPSRRAVERIAATSDPAPGSVRPKHASFSPFACGVSQRCFCSSVPYFSSESELSPTWTEMSVRNAASPRSISSHASASATKSRPEPPYSSGMTIPRIPSSAIPSMRSRSSLCSMSFWMATGSTRSSTNERTVSWIRRCSSLRAKSTRSSLSPVERREAVDRLRVLLPDVCAQPVGALLREPRVALRPLAGVLHQRHAVSARVGDAVDVDADRAAHAAGGVVRRHELAAAVEAHDPRRAVEGAEHDADAAVVPQVGDRLRTTADVVVVLDRPLVDDPERADRPLRRDVHVAAARRRRRDEEQALPTDPVRQLRVDALEDLSHRNR